MPLLLKHQSIEQFLTRLREDYRNSTGDRNIQLSQFIIATTQAGDLTDTDLRTAFGMTISQWNSLKVRMNSRLSARATIQSAVGE